MSSSPATNRIVFASLSFPGENGSDENPSDSAKSALEPVPGSANEFKIAEGQVTTPDGAGHKGVTVTVRRKIDAGEVDGVPISNAGHTATERKPASIVEDAPIAVTQTDALGDFTVVTPEPIRGTVIISLAAPDHFEVTREVAIGADFVPPYLAETLEGNLTLTGHIIDAKNQKAVAGAAVLLNMFYREWEADSDNTGRFAIQRVPPGHGEIVVTAAGYGREVHRFDLSGGQAEVQLVLRTERIVHFDIVDESGKPVADAALDVYDPPRDDLRSFTSDAIGHVAIRGMHADVKELSLFLAHEFYVSSQGFDRVIELPLDDRESTHKLVMVTAGAVSGRITEAESGKAVYGARVRAGASAESPGPSCWSDYEGNYLLSGISTGPVVVTAHMAGFGPELETVPIASGKTAVLNFELRSGRTLNGVVKTESGSPVAQMHVATGLWRGHTTLDLHAMTDDQGRFAIADVPGDEFEITVQTARGKKVTQRIAPASMAPIEMVVPDAPPRPVVGGPAPAVKLTALDGQDYGSAALTGKYVLYDFWATWCGPCVAELPDIRAAFKKFGMRKDFVLLGISQDFDEKALRDFLSREKITWPQVFGEKSGAAEASEVFGVVGIPAYFLVGTDGRIIAADFHGAEIDKIVEAALRSAKTE